MTDLEQVDDEYIDAELDKLDKIKTIEEANQNCHELILVPDINPNCRLCKLSQETPELYNWVCTLTLQGNSASKIVPILEDHMKVNYPEINPFSYKTIYTHFKKHMPPKESVEIMVAKKTANDVANKYDKLENIETFDLSTFDEYKELCALYVKFRTVHNTIYEFTESLLKEKTDDTNGWSQPKIQTYVSMINTQKSILSEIGKMRQSDKLVVTVAKFIVEIFARSIVERLGDEFSSLESVMKRQGVDGSILQAFHMATHERLARLILDEANNAMTITKKEFKLPTS